MLKQLTLILLVLILFSCNEKSKICKLTISLENAPKSAVLYLVDHENNSLIDSLTLVDGKSEYEMDLKFPKQVLAHNKRNKYAFRDRKFVWLEPSEISISGDFEFLQNMRIKGSDSHSEFEEYRQILDNASKQINKMKEQVHFQTDVEKEQSQIKIEQLKDKYGDSIASFMLKHPNSFVTLSSLHQEAYMAFRHLSKNKIKVVYDNLPNDLKTSKKGLEIEKFIDLPNPPKVGDIAPEIVQITPYGDTIKLSDFRGKYVLLDFWASWCGPCRGSHKKLIPAYNKYKSLGFEIFSVSGDDNRNHWIKAIKNDSTDWIQVSDMNGWYNKAFLRYDIKYVPQNFLISPEGVILNDKHYCNIAMLDEELNGLLIKNGL